MTDMNKPKKHGNAASKDITFPLGQKEPLDATVSDWSRELNQAPSNPGVPNPKRSRAERELYSRGGGQL